jgi:hypothetical protein
LSVLGGASPSSCLIERLLPQLEGEAPPSRFGAFRDGELLTPH